MSLAKKSVEHILSNSEEGILWDRYFEAFAKYRDRLPRHIADFGADFERFTLNHPKSLHDSWLESIHVREIRAVGETPSSADIQLTLLGQQHDRHIVIRYQGVTSYQVHGTQGDFHYFETFHGDVFTHEVRVADNGSIVHEIAFVTGSTILITCSDFKVIDEIFGTPNG